MATKAPGKTPAKQPAKVLAPKVEAEATTAAAPAPVPPVADPAPVAAAAPVDVIVEEVPVAAAVAVESVVDTITDTVEAVTPASLKEKGKTMADTIKNMTAQGEKFVAELKTRSEDAVAKGKAYFADMNEFNKGNIEAIVESGKIAAKGFEKLGQEQADYARKSFEQTTAAFKGMAAVKSPTELVKLHSDYVRTSFDAMVAQTSHSTEAFLKLAGEIAQPISNRFAVAAEKVKVAA